MKCEKWKKYYFADEEEIPKGIDVWIKENDKEGDTEPFDFDNKCFKERFTEQYSKYYFEGEQDQFGPEGINKSSECIEQVIERLLKKNEWDYGDVFNLIAWKTGAIRHTESKAEEIKYTDGSNKEAFILQPPAPATKIAIDEAFRKSIIECRTNYVEERETDEKIWKELFENGKKVKGMGTVYLVTLFSFITGGEYPIYDRFAMAGLVALKMNKNGIVVPTVSTQGNKSKEAIFTGCKLPEKTSTKAKDLLKDNSIYRKYIGLLNDFFDEDWKTNRGIDQALWVYGHYFNVE